MHWDLIGLFCGYGLLMVFNPVRTHLRNGLRILLRYPLSAQLLGAVAVAQCAHSIGMRLCLSWAGVPREWGWSRPDAPGALWELDRAGLVHALSLHPVIPALETVAAVFTVPGTFPVASVVALLMLVNFGGMHSFVARSIRERFPRTGVWWHVFLVSSAICAVGKPFLPVIPLLVRQPGMHAFWVEWQSVCVWLGFGFEMLAGLVLQVAMILVAHTWLAGRILQPARWLESSVQRSLPLLPLAAGLIVVSTVLMDLPLITFGFTDFGLGLAGWNVCEWWIPVARILLATLCLLVGPLECESVLNKSRHFLDAVEKSGRFVRSHAGQLLWFVISALLHAWLLRAIDSVILAGTGEGSALWLLWRVLSCPLYAVLSVWLLFSWVSVWSGGVKPLTPKKKSAEADAD